MESKPEVFLVVEPDLLIARDLEEGLCGAVPGAVVRLARGAEEAMQLLAGMDRLAAAFLRLSREEITSGDLAREVQARGGGVVILDAPIDGTDEGEGWVYTGRPFGMDAVPRALRRLGLDGRYTT